MSRGKVNDRRMTNKNKKWQNKERCVSKEDEINNKSDWRKINMIKKKDAQEKEESYTNV